MPINLVSLKTSIPFAFFNQPVSDEYKEYFRDALTSLFKKRNPTEDETYYRDEIRDFLKKIFSPDYEVQSRKQVKGSGVDLAIFSGSDAKTSNPAVLIEVKAPKNISEMFSLQQPNTKALQELVLYFMREFFNSQNLEIKYLAITNFDEWYFFDAKVFVRYFGSETKHVYKQYDKFRLKQLTGDGTNFFYDKIAKPAIDDFIASCDIPVVHFSLADIINDEKKKLSLCKFLSPETLLAKPFANDSNTLDRNFYAELLHIIGLEEVNESENGSKKIIQRKKEANRDPGSLLEGVLGELRTDMSVFSEEARYETAVRLCITWINRLLFLKLVESQVLQYHKGEKEYRFLNREKLKDFHDINDLFFKVLGCKIDERDADIKVKFPNVPYLNSSLFELTDDERHLQIRGLKKKPLGIFRRTVLKDNRGKKEKGSLDNLDYIFRFLDAYNFASDAHGGETLSSKTLINASVLGLIFEKINGYKDGSFFTPGFITDYMTREVLLRCVIQKFNEIKGWKCKDLEDLKGNIADAGIHAEANTIVNNIRVADIAVGSGHFLVSALNNLLAIKSELNILCDVNGKRIPRTDLILKVENDELSAVDYEGDAFEYRPGNEERQRIQEALFNEKRRIIENCLFGVDINPNSVNICRLRLWIELLKNAYYTRESGYTRLETLPNIDINIKVGNSLLSQYPVQNGHKVADYLSEEEKKDGKKDSLKNCLVEYRVCVSDYKSGGSHNSKILLRQKIASLKSRIVEGGSLDLFEGFVSESDETIDFTNSLEWMFEFPEILDEKGRFEGFDVVLGNPPYGLFNKKQNQNVALTQDEKITNLIRQRYPEIDEGMVNAAKVFYAFGFRLLKKNGFITMIVPFGMLSDASSVKIRREILEHHSFLCIDIFPERDSVRRRVFEDAKMSTAILLCSNKKNACQIKIGTSFERKIPEAYNLFSESDIIAFSPDLYQIPMCSREAAKLLLQFKSLKKFGDVAPSIEGEVHMSKCKSARTCDSSNKTFLKGAQISRWFYKTDETEISQGEIEYIDESKLKKVCSAAKMSLSKHERIVFQRLTGINEKIRLKGTIIPSGIYIANSVNNLAAVKDYSLIFLLALLNSNLLNFVFKARSTSSNVNGYEVNSLPFPNINEKNEILVKEIADVAGQIYQMKASNHNSNVADQEYNMNQLIYELYGLNDDDITLIEKLYKD